MYKLKRGDLDLILTENFFAQRMLRHWHWLPREAVVAPPQRHSRPGWLESGQHNLVVAVLLMAEFRAGWSL